MAVTNKDRSVDLELVQAIRLLDDEREMTRSMLDAAWTDGEYELEIGPLAFHMSEKIPYANVYFSDYEQEMFVLDNWEDDATWDFGLDVMRKFMYRGWDEIQHQLDQLKSWYARAVNDHQQLAIFRRQINNNVERELTIDESGRMNLYKFDSAFSPVCLTVGYLRSKPVVCVYIYGKRWSREIRETFDPLVFATDAVGTLSKLVKEHYGCS